MIPNLYKMAAEFLPGVLHVSAKRLLRMPFRWDHQM